MVTKDIYSGSNTIPAGVKSDEGVNLVGLTVFAIVFGVVVGKLGEKGKPLVAFFSALNDAVMMLVTLIMWYSPIGVCSMIAARVAEMEDVWLSMQKLGMFIATVSIGLIIHTLVVLPIIYFTVTRKNPYAFIKGLRDAMMIAFGIASSAATLPTTIRCVEENNGVDPRISRFMLPLGATVNMDGSALNRPVVIIFVAQLNDIDLSPGKIVTICVMSVLIAVGASAIPGSAMTTTIVLQSVSLPLHDLGLILAVDWLLDRFITVTNILGDAMGTGIVEHLSRDELKTEQEANNNPGNIHITEKFLEHDEPRAHLMITGV
ncbi:Excitatory amino acid transporter 2 [Desmophyllum pertusum]|uniref:Amino acid transporter n=1 Tax=Desmophyllum pertusum TaxID=174260 RepID=A0A9X0D8B9_9CNID|nr:Excitatory amino acid transporter 2 [Desmophyllum pertusum]